MLNHPSPGVLGKAALDLAARITDFSQIRAGSVGIINQHLASLIAIEAFDLAQAAQVIAQLDTNLVQRVTKVFQSTAIVIVQVNTVVVAVAQLRQPQPCRCLRGGFEQAIHTIGAFNQQLTIAIPSYGKPLTCAEYCTSKSN